MMSRAVAITCQGVSKSFALVDGGSAWRLAFGLRGDVPHFTALEDVSFDVPKGQFLGVLGRNGAGKSTLLRVIGGVYAPDSGRVAVHGAMSGLYELGLVGNPELTGRQYADRLLTVHGFSPGERAAMILDIHDFSELGDRFEDPVLTYSAGMSARLYFSTATAGQYEVYLLDEVLAVGDQHFQSKCWRRLRERVSGGASGVLVTHDWSAIVRLCETAHVLDRGKVVFSGPAERAVRRYLYGEQAKSTYRDGIARFASAPVYPRTIMTGTDFSLEAKVEILARAEVGVVVAVERLQPAYGWETGLMSRRTTPVGEEPGRYAFSVDIPALPLPPGSYQISMHLVMPDPHNSTVKIVLDGFSWLDGNGLELGVEGVDGRGFSLPAEWKVVG
ncbi:lipopolysaccharide transport system ATP-binding protein [Bradyrhizobium sp. USDA 4473]